MAKVVEETRNVYTVSLQEAIDISKQLISTLSADECPSILFIGPVGIGKTEAVTQIARETVPFGGSRRGLNLAVRHLSQVHPLDMAGVGLDNAAKSMYYAKPPLYQELEELAGIKLCFFDEIDRAQPIAQSAMLQFLLSREINGYKAKDTYVIAAANAWHAQYTYELDKATASRLLVFSIEPTKRDWMGWAAKTGIDVRILMAVESCPDILNEHRKDNEGALKVADPRAWASLSRALKSGLDVEHSAAFIGTNAAKKLALYSRIQQDYNKEIKQVLAGKPVTLPADAAKTTAEKNTILFCVYLAAAAQVTSVDQARAYLVNACDQMDKERARVTSKLITYTIPAEKLCKDEVIQKLHLEMVEEMLGEI